MRSAKLFIMACLATTFALGCSASYAQEHGRSVFVMGELGASTGLDNCFGTCSANPSETIGMGFNSDFRITPDMGTIRGSASLESARYQFNINGNTINAARKGFIFTNDVGFDERRRFILSWGFTLGWMTVSGTGISSTYFDPAPVIRFLYQVSPALSLSLGYTHDFIFTPNQPDFIANSVDAGLRWYLF